MSQLEDFMLRRPPTYVQPTLRQFERKDVHFPKQGGDTRTFGRDRSADLAREQLQPVTDPISAVFYQDPAAQQRILGKVAQAMADPMIVAGIKAYHGTNAKFTKFDINKIGSHTDEGKYGKGFYFTDKESAQKYGENVMPAELSITNPLEVGIGEQYGDVVDFVNDRLGIPNVRNMEELQAAQAAGRHRYVPPEEKTQVIQDAGHDGIIIRPHSGAETEYVVFSPEQIKLIDGEVADSVGAKMPDGVTTPIDYLGTGDMQPVIKNPTRSQAEDYLSHVITSNERKGIPFDKRDHLVRWIKDESGDMYMAPAHWVTHTDLADSLGVKYVDQGMVRDPNTFNFLIPEKDMP